MPWNYRLIAHKTVSGVYFQIHEVYYDENGVPNGYAREGETIAGDDINDIIADLELMKLATEKPILKAWDFPNEYIP